MSATKSSGTCTAFRTASQFPLATGNSGNACDFFSAFFMGKAGAMPVGTGGAILPDGIEIRPEELDELRILHEFLSGHVRQNMIRDVQCKLLWNEWVRTYRRQTHGFPNLILEKEFNTVVMDRFNVGIAEDGFRGAVYSGIRYVP